MNTMELLHLGLSILVSCIISACVTVWFTRKSNENAAVIIKQQGNSLFQALEDTLNEQLEPFKPLIKRSMTMAANAGHQSQRVMAVEREIMKAIQEESPISPELIKEFSPRLGEMLEEHPELLPKALQVLKKMGILEGEGMGHALQSRSHPLSGREE